MEQQELQFEVRDRRHKEKFDIDDIYLNGYAKQCGIYATGVYISLCRHVNKDQECWPSIKKIAEELNISTTQVRRSINVLEKYKIIFKKRLGKKLTNRYILLDRSEWSDRTLMVSSQDTHPLPDRTLHSKETHSKETQEKGLATPSVADKDRTELIDLFKSVNPSYKNLFARVNQGNAIKRLISQHGREKIEWLINILDQTNKIPFSPTITTPIELENKLGALLAFIQKNKNLINKNEVVKI